MTNNKKLAGCPIIPRLPDSFGSNRGDAIPSDLVGSIIARIGTVPDSCQVEGGGLVIDFIRPGEASPQRVVFGFTERGMWVEYQGDCAMADESSAIRISPEGYLRSMWTILAHSFLSPFKTTTVDLTTGKVVSEE